MRILSIYAQKTLPLVRRVLSPFSVLYTRNHPFAFQFAPQFNPGLGTGYDVTVLHQWVLTPEENEELIDAALSKYQVFVYDLADPTLLQNQQVRTTLAYCRMITVPNDYLKREVRIAVPGAKVEVLPSCLDIPYMMTAQRDDRPKEKTLGCFGPFDWEMLVGPLKFMMGQEDALPFSLMMDHGAHAVLAEHFPKNAYLVEVTPDTYPHLLKQCIGGLCPLEAVDGRDTDIVRHEWGYYGKPSTHFFSPVQGRTERMMTWMRSVLSGSSNLYHANDLIEEAKEYRSTLLADEYLRAYRKMLPHVR